LNWFDESARVPIVFGDNQSAIAVANASLPTKGTKHFLLEFHHVKEYAENIAYVATQVNKADPLTKHMGKALSVFMASYGWGGTVADNPSVYCCFYCGVANQFSSHVCRCRSDDKWFRGGFSA
jgi:hypothetical protein